MGRINNRYKRDMKQTAVEWLANSIINLEERLRLKEINLNDFIEEKDLLVEQAKEMEKEQMLDFGEFIIDELAPMAQNREWVEERYNYFKSE